MMLRHDIAWQASNGVVRRPAEATKQVLVSHFSRLSTANPTALVPMQVHTERRVLFVTVKEYMVIVTLARRGCRQLLLEHSAYYLSKTVHLLYRMAEYNVVVRGTPPPVQDVVVSPWQVCCMCMRSI